MAEEFQAGVCGGNWWANSSRSSPCTAELNEMGNFGWSSEMVGIKPRSDCDDSAASVSDGGSILFPDIHKPQPPDAASSTAGSGGVLIDSTLQMLGFNLSSSATTPDWNQTLLRGSGARSESSFHSMLQEDMSASRLNSPQIQISSGSEESTINSFKPLNIQGFSLDQQQLNPASNSTNDCAATCQGLSTGFSMGSASYVYPSTLMLQNLIEPEPQPQQSLFDNRSMGYPSMANYRADTNELIPTWPKSSSFLKPSLPKLQPSGHLHFSNNATYWNASAATATDVRASHSFFPPSQPQFLAPTFEEKPSLPNLPMKANSDEVRDSGSMLKKSSSETPFKRPRIETPSPLPTFKVRKEKLGDRITALQQLVSPFGKTDTASVLHEAIEYIKFLHDQVSVLSTPYMKSGGPIQHQQTCASDKLKEPAEGPKQDLRSRGLCLVPISSTFPVANETTADFWTPTFGGTFR
ncbi:transcription factor bHLH123-like [Malania oleifera]|uniref:transcription factor bHLH123-like n=1 Tax=Malania oleifera TaxID=397392 RepID=UPI0025ADA4D9|nr:transcription factor bHLH123-like [Malania oleifera]